MDLFAFHDELLDAEISGIKTAANVAKWLAAAGLTAAGAGIPIAYYHGKSTGAEEQKQRSGGSFRPFALGAITGAVGAPLLKNVFSGLTSGTGNLGLTDIVPALQTGIQHALNVTGQTPAFSGNEFTSF